MPRPPFLRAFVSPAALCALGFVAAMVAVLQFSLRAYIPGSLEPGGLTLTNFAALLRPLYGRVFLDTVWICFITAVCTLVIGYPVAYALVRAKRVLEIGDANHRRDAALSRRGGADLFLDRGARKQRFHQHRAVETRHHRAPTPTDVHSLRRRPRPGACDAAGDGDHARRRALSYRPRLRAGGGEPRRRPDPRLRYRHAPSIDARHRRRRDHGVRLDLQRLRYAAADRWRAGQHGIEPGLPARLCELNFHSRRACPSPASCSPSA